MKRKARRIKVDGKTCKFYNDIGTVISKPPYSDCKITPWCICTKQKDICEDYERQLSPESVTTEDFSYTDNPEYLEV
jgi:hypothetical protein